MDTGERLDRIIGDGIIDRSERLDENIEAVSEAFDHDVDNDTFLRMLEENFELLYRPGDDSKDLFRGIYSDCGKASRGDLAPLDERLDNLGFSRLGEEYHSEIPKIYQNKNNRRYTFIVLDNRLNDESLRVGDGLSCMLSTRPSEGHKLESRLKEFYKQRREIADAKYDTAVPYSFKTIGEDMKNQSAITLASIYAGIGIIFSTGNELAGAVTFIASYTIGSTIPKIVDHAKIKRLEGRCSEAATEINEENIHKDDVHSVSSDKPYDPEVIFRGYIASQNF